jgi:DNA-binding transcriptional regulator YiaG
MTDTIKAMRRELAFTQARMAEEMRVGLSTLRRYEHNPELTPAPMLRLAKLILGQDRLKRWILMD